MQICFFGSNGVGIFIYQSEATFDVKGELRGLSFSKLLGKNEAEAEARRYDLESLPFACNVRH
jgi:hypothetical protein